jgi:chromosome partitioning protein
VNDAHSSEDGTRRVATDDLVGIAEVAEMAGVSTAAVANWRRRGRGFPGPVAELRAGPVFSASAVRRWLHQQRKGPMTANVLATINLKGGVGKTTTTCALAEMLVIEHGERVLAIDLDPQTNLTTVLIGEQTWKQRNQQHQTLAQLFKDALEEDPTKRLFDLDEALIRGVSPVTEVAATRRLDLLPSSLDLIDVQDHLASMPAGRFHSRAPDQILQTALKQIIGDYDWVLIDCPPNLGLITLNGLRIAHGYVIPTIPDILSTYGIPQIVSRVDDYAREINEPIEPYGIIISMYRDQVLLHQNVVQSLRSDPNLEVFDTIIPQAGAIAASAEHQPLGTLRQKYQYGGRYQTYSRLCDEVVAAVEGARVP